MPNWYDSMQQTFEFYEVNPKTWGDIRKLDYIKSASISRDSSSETLGSASFSTTERIPEMYIRTYLVTTQNNVTEREELGVHLVQAPNTKYTGMVLDISADGYTPLIELKEKLPPLGFFFEKDTNILEKVHEMASQYVRPPIIKTTAYNIFSKNFVAEGEDTWLSYLTSALNSADYSFGLDERSQIIYMPNKTSDGIRPIWTFDSSNSSILYADISLDGDFYNVPNVVEVSYSENGKFFTSTVKNDKGDNDLSIKVRGREIVHRESSPEINGVATQAVIDKYAKNLLKSLSTIEYTISYSHGYVPIRLGDGVMINYPQAGIVNQTAKVISQSIDCTPGCKVTETATFTKNFWDGE